MKVNGMLILPFWYFVILDDDARLLFLLLGVNERSGNLLGTPSRRELEILWFLGACFA